MRTLLKTIWALPALFLLLWGLPILAADANTGLSVTVGTGTTVCAYTSSASSSQILTCGAMYTLNASGVWEPVSSTNPAPVAGTGTAGAPGGGVLTIQGAASMTPVLVTPSAPSDPCFASTKSYADFESTSSGGSIITAQSGKKAYVCAISVVTSTAANVSIIEGTGSSVCTGGTTAGDFLNTGTTAANGAAFAANGGINVGTGNGTIFANATANQNTCVLFSTTNTPQVNVHVSYVQQ